MHHLTESYIELKDIYQEYVPIINNLLLAKLSDTHTEYHTLIYRLKTPEKLEDKLIKKYSKANDLSVIYDIIGFRIICHFEYQVINIMNLIEREFIYSPIWSKILYFKLLNEIPYKMIQYGINISGSEITKPTTGAFESISFEIQIMTTLQHAGYEMQKLVYPVNNIAIPLETKNRYLKAAAYLEEAEKELLLANNEIGDSKWAMSDYFKLITSEMPTDTPLNLASLLSFVMDNDFIQTIDKRLMEHEFHYYVEEFTMLDNFVGKANMAGIHHLQELCLLLYHNQSRMVLFHNTLNHITHIKDLSISGRSYLGISIGTLCFCIMGKKGDISFAKEFYSKYKIKSDTYVEKLFPKIVEAYEYTKAELGDFEGLP